MEKQSQRNTMTVLKIKNKKAERFGHQGRICIRKRTEPNHRTIIKYARAQPFDNGKSLWMDGKFSLYQSK